MPQFTAADVNMYTVSTTYYQKGATLQSEVQHWTQDGLTLEEAKNLVNRTYEAALSSPNLEYFTSAVLQRGVGTLYRHTKIDKTPAIPRI